MKGYALVILGLLALFGRIEARPDDETTTISQVDKKADEVEEKKDDQSKTGEDSTITSTESVVEGKSGEKSEESDPADPKVKRATDEAPTQERTGEGSTEGSTSAAPVDEGKSGGHDEKEAKSVESTETPKVEDKQASEKSSKVAENKSDDHVNERSGVAERTGAAESKENKDSPKEEPKSTDEVSTSTEVVHQRSAYGSSSILETKGRSGETGESDSSDFKGRAHMNLRIPPVNPMGVINNINDIGSRRMEQPNLMLNIPQHFPPPIPQMLPKNPPPPFNSYLNAAPSMPSVANLPHLAQDRRRYDYRPETNAYPYSPTSSQQADSLSKFPTLRDLPKLPSYSNNFYKPYDQNYSGNFGTRPRRYTVPSVPDTMNRYAFNNFGYPQYIR